jgi:hypothetical protein
MFLAKHGTLGFDRLKKLLAPLLLLFWRKLSVCEVPKGLTQLVFLQLDGLGHGAILKPGRSRVDVTQDGLIWNWLFENGNYRLRRDWSTTEKGEE